MQKQTLLSLAKETPKKESELLDHTPELKTGVSQTTDSRSTAAEPLEVRRQNTNTEQISDRVLPVKEEHSTSLGKVTPIKEEVSASEKVSFYTSIG